MKQVLQIKMYPVSYGQGSFVRSTVLKIFNLYFYNNRAIFSRSDWWRAIVNDKPGKWCDDGKIRFPLSPGTDFLRNFSGKDLKTVNVIVKK